MRLCELNGGAAGGDRLAGDHERAAAPAAQADCHGNHRHACLKGDPGAPTTQRTDQSPAHEGALGEDADERAVARERRRARDGTPVAAPAVDREDAVQPQRPANHGQPQPADRAHEANRARAQVRYEQTVEVRIVLAHENRAGAGRRQVVRPLDARREHEPPEPRGHAPREQAPGARVRLVLLRAGHRPSILVCDGPVAQGTEREPSKLRVAGSNPAGPI